MQQSAPYAIIGFGVIVMALIAWWFGFRNAEEEMLPEPAAPTIELSEGLSIYTSGEYGFLFAYPSGAEISELFESPWLSDAWSVNALPDATGIPLVSVVTYRTESEDSYPRHFEASVRIGKSDDAREVARCLSAREGSGEVELPDRVIGEQTFAAFSFGDAGMQRYVNGVSYRTLYQGVCYAVEQIRAGSSYREDESAKDIPEETLTAAYDSLDTIIESFRFAR